MADLYQFKPMLGPAEEYPVGSIQWAERVSNRLQISAQSVSRSTAHHLGKQLKEIWHSNPRPWQIWPKDKPFGTPDDYCRAVTGHSWEALLAIVGELTGDPDLTPEMMITELARAQACGRSQGTRTDLLPAPGRKLGKQGSNNKERILRTLARDHPAVFARYKAGEFDSAKAAGRAAGIVKDTKPFDQIRKLIEKHHSELTEAERRQLKDLL